MAAQDMELPSYSSEESTDSPGHRQKLYLSRGHPPESALQPCYDTYARLHITLKVADCARN